MKLGILYKEEKLKDRNALTLLSEGFRARGIETEIFTDYDRLAGLDVAVVLGGDGALIHAAVVAAQNGVKIVGINYGTLGFLTEYESRDTEKIISLIADGKYKICKRAIIQVECGGKIAYGLNEVSLQRNALSPNVKQMVEFGAEMNGVHVDDFLSDGLILCTPTGSTAYSLSAGGCIMTPELNAFMITPICAFSLRSRPIVFSDEIKLSITCNRVTDRAIVFCDGKFVAEVAHGDKVNIQKAPFTADFITGETFAFFDKLNSKFGK